jgi:hypothetical protein
VTVDAEEMSDDGEGDSMLPEEDPAGEDVGATGASNPPAGAANEQRHRGKRRKHRR